MKEQQKPLFKEWWFYVVIAVFLIVIYLVLPKNSFVSSYSNLDSFASCLTSKGVTMFGTEWCPHCKNQKALFGKSAFKNIDFVDCDIYKDECLTNLVTGYPTWKINGQNYAGEQSLEGLAGLSGCELVAK